MDLSRYFSVRRCQRSQERRGMENENARSYLPLFSSPINEDALRALSNRESDVEKMTIHTSVVESSATTILAGDGRTSSGNIVVYKPHHEASSIELFYDLFFVGNLAYFTAMHQHTDAESLINYLKLFTLMWFTWLGTTLFDVRFGLDCVWTRLHKAIQFGVFTGFVFAGPVFDKYNNNFDGESYRQFALVLMVSRATIALQYAVVMWQSRMFRQTLVPLGLSTAVYVAASIAYLVTMAAFPNNGVGSAEQIIWVTISITEGLAVLLIAMTWRIVSFKYTHIVERLQLLTLIIIGEGIIGMIKSVASITKGQADNNSTELGSVIAAVLLLYLIYMLYFDQFSEDRFGTLRQQIWSLLHYPLHMAIVICVEGNTSLIVWNSAVQALRFIWGLESDDYSHPAEKFDSSAAYIASINSSMYGIDQRFRSKKWEKAYNWNPDLALIANYTEQYEFKSDMWNNKTGELVKTLFTKAQVFVFEAHSDTLAKLNVVTPVGAVFTRNAQEATQERLEAIYDVFNVTVMSFYIGAGAMLLVLAILYWFNKMHKTKYEFGEMINRVVVGFALIIMGVATVIGDKSTEGFKFVASHWIITIVVLCFILVLVLDNFLLWLSRKTLRRNARRTWHLTNLSGSNTEQDNSTLTLLRGPCSRATSRSRSRSAPMSRNPSTSNLLPLSHSPRAEGSRAQSEHRRGRLGASETTSNVSNVVDFAYHVPPQSYLRSYSRSHSRSNLMGQEEREQIGLALSPSPLLSERNTSRDPGRGRGEKGKGKVMERTRYETVEMDMEGVGELELASDGEMRNLIRARTT